MVGPGKPTTEAEVILDTDGRPVFQVMEAVGRHLKTIQGQIDSINKSTHASAKDFQKSIEVTTKQLRDAMSSMATLGKVGNVPGVGIQSLNNNQGLARQTRSATEYAQSLKMARDGAEALRGKINDLNRAIAARGSEGQGATIAQRDRLAAYEKQLATLKALDAQQEKIDRRIARTKGGDLAAETRAFDQARARLQTSALDPKKNSLTREIKAAQLAQDQLTEAVNRTRTAQAALTRDERGQRLALAGRDVRNLTSGGSASSVRSGLQFERQLAEDRLAKATGASIAPAREALALADARLRKIDAIVRREEEEIGALQRRNQLEQSAAARLGGQMNTQYQVGEAAKIREVLSIQQQQASVAARIAALRLQAKTASGEEARSIQQQLRTEEAIGGQLRKNLTEVNAQVRAQERLASEKRKAEAASSPLSPKSVLPAGGFPTVFARTAAYGAAGAALFGLVNILRQGAQFTVEFEDKLKTLQAIANATDEEMVKLTGSITSVGETSRFSLTELTDMAAKLAQAGVSAGAMGEALGSVSSLATASGSSPAEAVDLITAALGSFQLQASETPRIADLITSALNRTRLTVQQAALAIQYVGATAYDQNISLEQLLATAGALSQAGIRSGSTIGTGMRQFLVDLQTPSEKLTEQLDRLKISSADVDVKTRGLPAVLQTLRDKGFGASQAYGSLETRAAAFYLVARNNTDIMQELQLSFANTGAAALAQERAMDSLSAQWQRFLNIVGEDMFSSSTGILASFKTLLKQISDRMIEARTLANQPRKDTDVAGNFNKLDKFVTNGIDASIEAAGNMAWSGGSNSSGVYTKWGGLGTAIISVGRNADQAASSIEVLTTRMNEQGQAAQIHEDKITGLDKEIERLILQEDSLNATHGAVGVETVNLGSRFQGLSAFITTTSNDVAGLIGAMRQLRNQEAGLLIEELSGKVVTANAQIGLNTKARDSAIAGIQSNPNVMKMLSRSEQQALKDLQSGDAPTRANATGVLRDVSSRWTREKRFGLADAINPVVSSQGNIATAVGEGNMANRRIGDLNFQRSGIGQQIDQGLGSANGIISKMSSANAVERKKLAGQLDAVLKPLEARLDKNIGTNPENNPFQVKAREEVRTARSSANALLMPTKAQTRAQAKEEAAATREERKRDRADQSPPVTRAAIIDVAKSLFGNSVRVGSGYRSQAQQDALPSRTKAKISDHTTGIGQDFPTGPISDAQGEQMARRMENGLRARGLTPKKVQFENGRNGNGTGPHIHVGFARGARQSGGADRDGSIASGQIDLSNAKLGVANADKNLKGTLKDLKYATSEQVFSIGEKAARDAFDAWVAALTHQTEEEIGNSSMTNDQAALRRGELADQIAQRREDLDRSIFDGVLKNMDAALKVINDALEAKTQASQAAISRAQSTIEGFGYYSNRNRIPDYVQTLAEGRLGRAQEAGARDRLSALPSAISGQEGLLAGAMAKRTALDTSGDQAGVEAMTTKINELTKSIADLRTERDGLEQAFSAGSLVPTTISQGLDQAIAAYRETHNLTNTFSQDLIENMGGALGQVHEGLTTMFTDILSGSTTVLGAFANFVQGMIKYMIQLAAKALATKVFSMILGAVAGKIGGSAAGVPTNGGFGGGYSDAGMSFGGMGFGFNGAANINGRLVPGLMTGGGRVSKGSSMRDSVPAMIAKDEWVVNKKAVDSVGHDFMSKLNSQGASALDAMRAAPVIVPQSKDETNIYIVKENQRPQLGKNDILLAVQEDILSGGETKKLIHHVAKGG